MSVKECNYFSRTNDLWLCLYCRYVSEIFPFTSLENHELVEQLVFNSNTECLCSVNISRLKLESFPSFDISIFINNNSALFMQDYYSNRLPSTFNNFFKSINKVHQYGTRLAPKKSYYLPKAGTNYGKFNVRFSGANLWNAIKEDLKSASRFRFKKLLKESVISKY